MNIKKSKTKKEYGRGGKREGSGRPRQFEEPTTMNFKLRIVR